jgi:hypothetical protein
MKSVNYFNDISTYVKHGNKQNSSEAVLTDHNQSFPAEAQDLKTKISTRFAQFGRVAIVTGLAIVSAPIAIASAIVFAVPFSIFRCVSSVKCDIQSYIQSPKQERKLINLLKEIGVDCLRSTLLLFVSFVVVSVDLTFLLMTYLAHTNHMQIWQMLCSGGDKKNTAST